MSRLYSYIPWPYHICPTIIFFGKSTSLLLSFNERIPITSMLLYVCITNYIFTPMVCYTLTTVSSQCLRIWDFSCQFERPCHHRAHQPFPLLRGSTNGDKPYWRSHIDGAFRIVKANIKPRAKRSCSVCTRASSNDIKCSLIGWNSSCRGKSMGFCR